MTTLNLTNRSAVNSLISFRSGANTSRESVWSFKQFKKAYTGLNCILSWGEKICSPQTVPLVSEKRQILKLHAGTFNVPEWFEKVFKLSNDITEVTRSKNPIERNEAAKKIFFTSIDFTNASIKLTQCFNDIHWINLAASSPLLPRALSGTACIGQLILKVNELYKSYTKSHARFEKVQARSLWVRLKLEKNVGWKVLEAMRNLLGILAAILTTIVFFFTLHLSPYWMLGISTFNFVSSLAAELHASL